MQQRVKREREGGQRLRQLEMQQREREGGQRLRQLEVCSLW